MTDRTDRTPFGNRLARLLGVGAGKRFADITGTHVNTVSGWSRQRPPPPWADLMLDMIEALDTAGADRPAGFEHRPPVRPRDRAG